MPIIAVSASARQRPPAAWTRSLRARIHNGSESTRTPSMSNTTADLFTDAPPKRPCVPGGSGAVASAPGPGRSGECLDGGPLDDQTPAVALHVDVETGHVVGDRLDGLRLGL